MSSEHADHLLSYNSSHESRLARAAVGPLGLWCLGLALVFAGQAAAAQGDAGSHQRLLDERSEAIVRVETVLTSKVSMGGQAQEEESRIDLTGAVVHPKGLIMLWNSNISSSRLSEMLSDMRQGGDFKMEIAPTAFTVLVGGEERSAFLAATDSALDLAFIQLEETPEADLAFVDYSQSAEPAVGDRIVQVLRLSRTFDDAPYLISAEVAGRLRKPRAAWIVDGELTGFGLPVFDSSGSPVGALMTIYSRAGEESGGMMMGPMSGFMGNSSPLESLHSFVLPGKRVAGLIRLAHERATELAAKRAAADESTETESSEEVSGG